MLSAKWRKGFKWYIGKDKETQQTEEIVMKDTKTVTDGLKQLEKKF